MWQNLIGLFYMRTQFLYFFPFFFLFGFLKKLPCKIWLLIWIDSWMCKQQAPSLGLGHHLEIHHLILETLLSYGAHYAVTFLSSSLLSLTSVAIYDNMRQLLAGSCDEHRAHFVLQTTVLPCFNNSYVFHFWWINHHLLRYIFIFLIPTVISCIRTEK